MKKFSIMIVCMLFFVSSAYAWWNSDYKSKYTINNLNVTKDMNNTNMIVLENVDFTNFNIFCSDANDLRIVNEATETEISEVTFQSWDGTNTDSDVNVIFSPNEDMPTASYDGNYYFYTNNSNCPAVTRRQYDTSFDDFEDGDFTSPMWETYKDDSRDTIEVQSSTKKNGTYAVRMVNDYGDTRLEYTAPYHLLKASTFIRTTETTQTAGIRLGAGVCQTAVFGGYLRLAGQGYGWQNSGVEASADTWYWVVLDMNSDACHAEWYDEEGGNLLANIYQPQNSGLTYNYIAVISSLDSGKNTFFDDITFDRAYPFTYSLGSEESSNVVPDINILTIEGIDDDQEIKLSYDGNSLIEIKVEVFDPNAEDLNLSLYYDTSSGGTSNIIVEDLNLNNTYCMTDMNGSSKNVCSYDWNIFSVSSDNYYVRAIVKDTQDTNDVDDNEYEGGILIDNTDPSISDIIINYGNNLDGINYDLNATITDSTGMGTVSYKCYTSTPESCVSESWDCHLGNMQDLGSDVYGAEVTGNVKDTAESWTCQITANDVLANQAQDINTTTMNDVLSVSVDATSGTYGAINLNSTENPISTNLSNPYFVITHGGNTDLNIVVSCGDLNSGNNGIDKSNQKWCDSDVYGSSTSCNGNNQTAKSEWAKGVYPTSSTQNLYFWLNVPAETQIANNYTGTIAIASLKS